MIGRARTAQDVMPNSVGGPRKEGEYSFKCLCKCKSIPVVVNEIKSCTHSHGWKLKDQREHSSVPTMPSTPFIHVACFTVGALVGGGVATAISSRRPTPVARPPPVLDLDKNGDARLSTAVAPTSAVSAVLKYGHPGGCRQDDSSMENVGH